MNQTLENSLQLARLLYQKGDFLEALAAFENAESDALACQNLREWLDCLRLQMQCLSELDQFEKAASTFHKVKGFCQTADQSPLLARGYFVLAFYYLQLKDLEQAQGFLNNSIQLATASQDIDYLERALVLEIYMHSLGSQQNWAQAHKSLDKIELLLQSHPSPDIEITCLLLRAHSATARAIFDEAANHLWKAYEKAQTSGHHMIIPSLLFQMGRLHRDLGQKTQGQIFFDLSLRGIDSAKHPRQYRLIANEARREGSASFLQFDFIVNQDSRMIQEKQRGYIDFKNQHLLLDLALLFLKNPGQRFSKEDILEKVWKQAYDPGLHDNLIYVSIKRLRSLIEPDAENPRYILRDRRGYYLSSSCSISFENTQETTI